MAQVYICDRCKAQVEPKSTYHILLRNPDSYGTSLTYIYPQEKQDYDLCGDCFKFIKAQIDDSLRKLK